MTRLHELQQRFQDYLIGTSEEVENDIISSENALAEYRLGAYYNACRIRLIDILALDYSAIEKYLGREAFENLALDYLRIYPSRHPSVRWFGQHLSEYLSDQYDREDSDFVTEIARFEWARGLVFDGEDANAIVQIEDMARVPPESWPNLRIKFIPALRWLDLYWNACPYAVALDNGETPPDRQHNEIPVRWLIWRRKHNPNWRSLEVHEAWAIEAAQQGASFAELCKGLCEWISEDQVAMTAAGLLKQWVSDELVVRVEF